MNWWRFWRAPPAKTRLPRETTVSGAEILPMRDLARQMPIASHVSEYVARLIVATHPDSPKRRRW